MQGPCTKDWPGPSHGKKNDIVGNVRSLPHLLTSSLVGGDLFSKSPFIISVHQFLPYPVPQGANGHDLHLSVLGFPVTSSDTRHWKDVGGEFKQQKTLEGRGRVGGINISSLEQPSLVGASFGEGGRRKENRKFDASRHFPFANAYMVYCPIFRTE